jgi:hypothetical protein
MPNPTRANCLNCGKHKSEVGPISWGGYCGQCGPLLFTQNMDGLHTKRGVAWQRYRVGVATAAFGQEVTAALWKAGIFTAPLDEQSNAR